MPLERLYLWIAFNLFVLGMLALDLGVFHRKAHTVSLREASVWSAVWIALAMIFNLGILFFWGHDKALEFLTGYVIEKSLSVDNLFVFLMIFQYFATPPQFQHRLLFWGIAGALILRAIFIATGAALLESFHWMIYIFGGFLVITGVRMLLEREEKLQPEKNPVVRLFQRWIPLSHSYHGQHFFVRLNGKTHATMLMLVLVVVETTDVIFAADSIPAIFAITRDPFIVYTSNVFAILGLRALYFLLAGIMQMFAYLKVGLSFVLVFVGAKMLVADVYEIPIGVSLATVGGILALSILVSLVTQWRSEGVAFTDVALDSVRGLGSTIRRHGLAAVRVAQIAALIFIIGVALVGAKWHAIATGPSGNEVIAALRVVHREVAEARLSQRPERLETVQRAEHALEQAWSDLRVKRYEEAMASARKADQLLATAGVQE
jgi:tellurite resistance protein TerC